MPSYSFTSGEDAKSRDPLAWDVSGSLNGSDWVILDERSNFTFSDRLQTADFRLAPGNASLAFSQYRFRFFETRKSSSDSLQLTGIGEHHHTSVLKIMPCTPLCPPCMLSVGHTPSHLFPPWPHVTSLWFVDVYRSSRALVWLHRAQGHACP